ncbi:hypothetical protein [Octadecabacter sp. R77987]|uniref:hypothetical protein n=1 Tax=Octadecabacter sp. R77987 TaxID=3093874 RepID=UPI00366C51A1
MNRLRLALVLLACALTTPAIAETSLSLGGGISFDKHEFQGMGSGPHYSLTGQGGTAFIEVTRHNALTVAGRPVAASLSLHRDAPSAVDTASDGRAWAASLDRGAQIRTTRTLVTLSTPVVQQGNWSLDLGVGVGLARTDVTLRHGTATTHQRETLPHAALSLRAARASADGRARVWSELRYHTSPALTLTFDDGEQRRHEISGLELAAGVTFFIE